MKQGLNPDAGTTAPPENNAGTTPPPAAPPAPAKTQENNDINFESDDWVSKLAIDENQKKYLKKVVSENISRRQSNSELTEKNTELSKKLKEYEDKEKTAKRQKDEEDGNFKKVNEDLKAELAAKDQRILKAEVRNQAIKEGIVDPSMIDLLPLEGVNLDKDGEVIGAEAFVKKLKKDRAYLFGSGENKAPTTPQPTTSNTTPPNPNSSPSKVDALTMSDEDFKKHLEKERGKKR